MRGPCGRVRAAPVSLEASPRITPTRNESEAALAEMDRRRADRGARGRGSAAARGFWMAEISSARRTSAICGISAAPRCVSSEVHRASSAMARP